MALAFDFPGYLQARYAGKGKGTIVLAWALEDAGWTLPPEKWPAEVAQWYKHDSAKAKQLLAEAGYPTGFKTVINANARYHMDDAPLIADMLSKAGIQAEINVREYAAHQATVRVGKYDGIFLQAYMAYEPDDGVYLIYHPTSALNRSHVDDSKLTQMVEEQRRTVDVQKRKKLVQDIQIYAADQAYRWILPQASVANAFYPQVQNFLPEPDADMGRSLEVVWLAK